MVNAWAFYLLVYFSSTTDFFFLVLFSYHFCYSRRTSTPADSKQCLTCPLKTGSTKPMAQLQTTVYLTFLLT